VQAERWLRLLPVRPLQAAHTRAREPSHRPTCIKWGGLQLIITEQGLAAAGSRSTASSALALLPLAHPAGAAPLTAAPCGLAQTMRLRLLLRMSAEPCLGLWTMIR